MKLLRNIRNNHVSNVKQLAFYSVKHVVCPVPSLIGCPYDDPIANACDPFSLPLYNGVEPSAALVLGRSRRESRVQGLGRLVYSRPLYSTPNGPYYIR